MSQFPARNHWTRPKLDSHTSRTHPGRLGIASGTLVFIFQGAENRLRWQIEILFRNLKHVLHIANFVSITENGIRIQIYAALIHYVLTHLIILKAAAETGRPLEDFSIPYCLDAVQQVLYQAHPLVLRGRTPNWEKLEARMVRAVIALGLRPNRKRKPLITTVKGELRRRAPLPAGGP